MPILSLASPSSPGSPNDFANKHARKHTQTNVEKYCIDTGYINSTQPLKSYSAVSTLPSTQGVSFALFNALQMAIYTQVNYAAQG